MPLRMFTRKPSNSSARKGHPPGGREFKPADRTVLVPDALEQALQLGRFGIIVNQPQRWQQHPNYKSALQNAIRGIDETFALIPEGGASIPLTTNDEPGAAEEDVETQPYLLGLHTVTNAQFQLFVDGGGYQDLELWPEEIWPHLIDFRDQTGHNAPRHWREGCHDQRLAKHPVVGICYYEAHAYALWAGMRLPNEAEWQMAASWRLSSAAVMGRRYPWGDTLDTERCNIWISGNGEILSVDACPPGAAPNGVMQLIGNVWEWTDSDYTINDTQGRTVVGDMLMKSIRGGAFDTYFPSQATSAFRTGLACLARTHNTGFRCALDLPEDAQEDE